MNQKNYIIKYKSDLDILDLNSSFINLDKLIDKLEIKKLKDKNINSVEVYDYRNEKSFYVDKFEAQSTFDEFYEENYYNFFLEKFSWCRELYKSINIRIMSGDDISTKEFNDNLTMIYFKSVMFSLKSLVTLKSHSINYNDFKSKLHFSFELFFDLEYENIVSICDEVIEGLIKDNLILKEKQNLFISDDAVRLDLIVISFSPVQVQGENSAFEIKYSCYYNLVSLYFVITKYLSTINLEYNEYLYNKYCNDTERFFILNNFLENYKDFDFSKNFIFKNDSYDYNLLCRIYVGKLILNDYCNQIIINSCFSCYYYSLRRNNLYRLSHDLLQRLVP